jgi:hypothetical protein
MRLTPLLLLLSALGPLTAADPNPGAAATAPALVAGTQPAVTTVKKHRIVFQVTIDGDERWNEVLNNVENVQRAFGPENVEIEIVAHGKGAGLVLAENTAIAKRLIGIEATGPRVTLCSNTARQRGITPAQITPGVTLVDSGIAEVVRRVEEGWVYIKAGS